MLIRTKNLFTLFKLIGVLVLLYSVCRLLFYVFNYTYFSDLNFIELVKLFFFSIRFDISVIVLSNALFVFLYLWPFPVRETKSYRNVLKWLFIIVNSIALFTNCVDLAYFQFTLKRTNASVINFFSGEIGNDFFQDVVAFKSWSWISIYGPIFPNGNDTWKNSVIMVTMTFEGLNSKPKILTTISWE